MIPDGEVVIDVLVVDTLVVVVGDDVNNTLKLPVRLIPIAIPPHSDTTCIV